MPSVLVSELCLGGSRPGTRGVRKVSAGILARTVSRTAKVAQGAAMAVASSGSGNFNARWQAQGQIDGAGAEVVWTPSSDEDQLDVAVRTRDGVAVTMLRLEQVRGSKDA